MIESEASSNRVYAPRMAGKPQALSVEERAKLSDVVTRLIGEHGSASKLEKVMAAAGHRVAQPTLSKAARGDDVGGYSFAKRVAAFLGQDVEEVRAAHGVPAPRRDHRGRDEPVAARRALAAAGADAPGRTLETRCLKEKFWILSRGA